MGGQGRQRDSVSNRVQQSVPRNAPVPGAATRGCCRSRGWRWSTGEIGKFEVRSAKFEVSLKFEARSKFELLPTYFDVRTSHFKLQTSSVIYHTPGQGLPTMKSGLAP